MTALVRQINPKEAAGQPYLMFTDPILDLPSFSKEPTCFLHHQPSSSSSGDAPLPCGLFLRPSKPPLSIRAPPQLSPDSPAALSPGDTPQAPYPGPECSVSLPYSSGHRPESGSVPPHCLPGDLRWLPSASSVATSLPCPAPGSGGFSLQGDSKLSKGGGVLSLPSDPPLATAQTRRCT